MKSYNKLVRDKVVEEFQARNQQVNSRVLDDKEFAEEIAKKIATEAGAMVQPGNGDDVLGFLADIVELVHAELKLINKSWEDMEAIRVKKLDTRGGFDKKIFLESVEE